MGSEMALNIYNSEIERLVEEIAKLAGESKTEALRRSLEERKSRLSPRIAGDSRSTRLKGFLEHELWPLVPPEELGRRFTRAEEEAILGYGESGV
jgi:antitoxin VapB